MIMMSASAVETSVFFYVEVASHWLKMEIGVVKKDNFYVMLVTFHGTLVKVVFYTQVCQTSS